MYVSMCVVLATCSVACGGLLDEHFGVTLALGEGQYDPYQQTTTYRFDPGSFAPTKHTDTVDYVVDDWYGYWSTSSFQATTVHGTYPGAAEPYDVEALYFDDDPLNLYIAVVTSFPGPPGFTETRLRSNPLVVAGDLALNLALNPEHRGDGFSYDYGVNISHEIRCGWRNAAPDGDVVGNEVFRTANSDWYVGTRRYAVPAGRELTNFDPGHRGFSGAQVGHAEVAYYEYLFDGGLLECGYPTYVIEVTIPREALEDLGEGDRVAVSWVEGCRNDGNDSASILRFDNLPHVDFDHDTAGAQSIAEAHTITLMALGMALAYIRLNRRRPHGRRA